MATRAKVRSTINEREKGGIDEVWRPGIFMLHGERRNRPGPRAQAIPQVVIGPLCTCRLVPLRTIHK